MKIKVVILIFLLFISNIYSKEISAKQYAKFGTKAFKLKLYKEAELRFKQAVQKDPKNPYYFNNLAIICEILGKIDEARNYYQEALKLAPKDKKIKENYERFENYVKNNFPSS